jgi:hypothetical protein
MKINWKTPEAFLFDGTNFDELKQHFPNLRKLYVKGVGVGVRPGKDGKPLFDKLRSQFEYTIGEDTESIIAPDPKTGEKVESFAEAFPGMWIVKGDGPDHKYLTEEQFKADYENG